MLEWMLSSSVMGILSWLGFAIGVIGLGLTIAVYRSTAAIRSAFLISARVPKQLEDLRTCASVISEYLQGEELDSVVLRKEVARLGEIANSIQQKTKTELASLSVRLEALNELAGKFEQSRTQENLMEIYVQAQGACEALNQWLSDRSWSSHDGK